MVNVLCRKDTGLLLLDFRWQGQRCREHTLLPETPTHRARLELLARKIDRAIQQGTFRYSDFFPNSRRALAMGPESHTPTEVTLTPAVIAPLFSVFGETWFSESQPRWRKRYRECMRDTLDRIFYPFFGSKRLDEIAKGDLLAFRAEIAKRPGRGGRTLSARRINKL
jgi:integrase